MWRQHLSDDDERDKRDERPRDLFDPTDRIAKLIRLLSSPVDGEVVGAARTLDRLLSDAGGFHHLADVVEAHWRPPIVIRAPPKPPSKPKHDWQIQAAHLLQHPEILLAPASLISSKTCSVREPRRPKSNGKWLGDIEARLPPGQGMAS